MQVNKLTEHIGAEVSGIDLCRPVDTETRQALNKAVVDNIALVIRDQSFTPQQFLAAMTLFGEPMEPNDLDHSIPGLPFVHEVSSRRRKTDGTVEKFGVRWHTDHTHEECPPKHTALYAVELPAKGGGTSFVNMRAGYASLPGEVRRRIDGMKTVNVVFGSAAKYDSSDRVNYRDDRNIAPILQPLVRTNPDSGSKALYFHPKKTENIVGMSPEESQALLDRLLADALKPEYVYSHQWRKGDMLIWDNRSALHKADYDYDPMDATQHRLLYRMLIRGERPY